MDYDKVVIGLGKGNAYKRRRWVLNSPHIRLVNWPITGIIDIFFINPLGSCFGQDSMVCYY